MSSLQARGVTSQATKLKSKYYCQVENDEVSVVMEIWPPDQASSRRLPLRYALVIDVSGSMDNQKGRDGITLLDRVKIFAQLAVQVISEDDYLAIVTFHSQAQTELKMTKMDGQGKTRAKEKLTSLKTEGQTNIGAGLFRGLEEILSHSCISKTRDSIILFTDGEANRGITEANDLAMRYKEIEYRERNSCIPLSAFTIGNYKPHMLVQLSAYLGSEAFYWLDENQHFESDMLIPLFLREITRTSDFTVEMEVMNGVTFRMDRISREHLRNSNATRGRCLKYFIHSLPCSVPKTIPIHLQLNGKSQQLKDKHILEIRIKYMDDNMEQQEGRDFITLCGTTLAKRIRSGKSDDIQELLDRVSSFIVFQGQIYSTWAAAEIALSKIATEECNRLGKELLEAAKDDQSPRASNQDLADRMRDNESRIEETRMRLGRILGFNSPKVIKFNSLVEKVKRHMTLGMQLASEAGASQANYARLSAMESAMSKQMPTAAGVFDSSDKQPFRPQNMEIKLEKFKTIVQETKSRQQYSGLRERSFEQFSKLLTSREREIEVAMECIEEENSVKEEREKEEDDEEIIFGVFAGASFILTESVAEKVKKKILAFGGNIVNTSSLSEAPGQLVALGRAEDIVHQTQLVGQLRHANVQLLRWEYAEECIREGCMANTKDYVLEMKLPASTVKLDRYDAEFTCLCLSVFAYAFVGGPLSIIAVAGILIMCIALYRTYTPVIIGVTTSGYILFSVMPLGFFVGAVPFACFAVGLMTIVTKEYDVYIFHAYVFGSYLCGACVMQLWLQGSVVLSIVSTIAVPGAIAIFLQMYGENYFRAYLSKAKAAV